MACRIGRDPTAGAVGREPDELAALPLRHPIGAAADQVGDARVGRPARRGTTGPDVAGDDPHVIGRVVELLGGRLREPDHDRGRVLGGHADPMGQVRPCGSLEHRVRKRLEGEPHVLGGDRASVLPPRAGPEVKAPGERIHPLPPVGQRGAIGRGVDRRGAGREVGQPLVDLVADVAADGLDHQRRQELRRLAGGGDHHGAAAVAGGAIRRAAGGRAQGGGQQHGAPACNQRSHTCLGGEGRWGGGK